MAFIRDRGRRGLYVAEGPVKMSRGSWIEPTGAAVFFDDFVGDTLATDNWLATETDNSGTTGTDWAISSTSGLPNAGHGGWIAAVPSADADDASEMLAGALAWDPGRAGSGVLVFDTVVNIRSYAGADIAWNVGLTDDRSSDKIPMEFSVATWTTNASDNASFVFDNDATTDAIYAQCVDSNTDGTAVTAQAAADVTAARLLHLRIEVDSTGIVYYYFGAAADAASYAPLDPAYVGSDTTGTSPSVLHCPIYAIETRDNATSGEGMEVDYCLVACAR